MGLLTLNLTDWMTRIIIGIYFIVAIYLNSKQYNVLSGFMFIIGAALLAANGVNLVICLILMAVGVITASRGDKR